jgi:hypothetical protein
MRTQQRAKQPYLFHLCFHQQAGWTDRTWVQIQQIVADAMCATKGITANS